MPQALREAQRRRYERRRFVRRRVLPVLALLAVAGAAFAALVVRNDDERVEADDTRPPRLRRVSSVPAPDLGGDLAIAPAPLTSRVVYRMRSPGSPDIAEQLWVRRPFESRLESYTGGSPGPINTETESGLRHRGHRSGNAAPVVLTRPPGLAVFDLRADVALADGIEAGLLQRREWRRVLDRPCQVFRTGATVADGRLTPVKEDGEYADVCIDAGGHVLEEWWVAEDGTPIRQRLALEVEDGLPLPDGFLRLPSTPTVAADQGAGSVIAITPDSRPPEAEFYALDTAPAGFTLRGRFTVVPPQAGLLDPTQRSAVVASVADVWTRGPDYLVVDQGGALNNQPTFSYQSHSRRVDLGALGQGEEVPGMAGNEVRVIVANGRHVRVHGTLPLRDLVAVARALHPTPGGTLTQLEPVNR